MQQPTLGALGYINSLPFFYPIEKGIIPCTAALNYDTPFSNNRRLRTGQLDIALISASEYLAQREHYTLLDSLCIGAKMKVMSVCLYTRLPVTKLSGLTVGLTDHSASSVNLLKVLCHHFWKVTPNFERFGKIDEHPQYDAFLLIGDASLQNPSFSGYATIDLAHAWYRETGLPFTFALFAAKKDTDPASVTETQAQLQKALAWSQSHRDEIIAAAGDKTALPEPILQEYFNTLQYSLTPEMQQGLETFNNLFKAQQPALL